MALGNPNHDAISLPGGVSDVISLGGMLEVFDTNLNSSSQGLVQGRHGHHT